MKHRKRGRKLSRTSAHRKATRQNLAKALFEHERIITTPAKAKEVKSFVEKLITLARKAQPYKNAEDPAEKSKYVHYYRLALKKLQDKKMTQKLFGEGQWRETGSLAERYADRPSGQTRIIRLSGSRLGTLMGYTVEDIAEFNYELNGKERKIKLTGNRLGDNSEQVIFELVREDENISEEDVVPEIASEDGSLQGSGSDIAQTGEEKENDDNTGKEPETEEEENEDVSSAARE